MPYEQSHIEYVAGLLRERSTRDREQFRDADQLNRKSRTYRVPSISRAQRELDKLRSRSLNDVLAQFEEREAYGSRNTENLLSPENPYREKLLNLSDLINKGRF